MGQRIVLLHGINLLKTYLEVSGYRCADGSLPSSRFLMFSFHVMSCSGPIIKGPALTPVYRNRLYKDTLDLQTNSAGKLPLRCKVFPLVRKEHEILSLKQNFIPTFTSCLSVPSSSLSLIGLIWIIFSGFLATDAAVSWQLDELFGSRSISAVRASESASDFFFIKCRV